MTSGNLVSVPLVVDAKTILENGHFPTARDILPGIAKSLTGKAITETSGRFDAKRLVERAIEIDAEQPGSPLTDGQWDFGLDMLSREEAPAEAGLAVRQERIIVALSKALAELEGGA